MNHVAIPLVWCMVQVTLIGLVTAMLYAVVRRVRPGAALPVVLAGLASVIVLTTLAFSPWPRWSLSFGPERPPLDGADPLEASGSAQSVPSEAAGAASNSLPADGQPQASIGGTENTAFWQILLEELSRPGVPAESSAWSWRATVSVVFLCAGGLAVLWFAAGMMAVRGYRRRSRPIEDPALRERIDVLRVELGCSRAIELRETDELVTAATIGWRRPVILLPTGWRDWTVEQCRAVLAHEVAHVRAGDYLAVLMGQLGLVLHFYHPLVHWLLGRLRLEQELAADAAAASVSGGQRAYLKAIAELALRQPHRPMAWPARSFLPTRTTFLRRISMLRDSKLSWEKASWPAKVLPMGLVVAFGFLIAGLRGPVLERSALAGPAEATTLVADKGAQEPSSEDGFDLSYVPKDFGLLVAFRPATVFRRPEFKEFATILSEFIEDEFLFLPPLDELKEVVVSGSWPVAASPDSAKWSCTVHANGPHDFRRRLPDFDNMPKREHMGHTYYMSSENPSGIACYFPDKQTIVAGMEAHLKAVIDARSSGLPEFIDFIDADVWPEFRKDHLLVAVNSTFLETAFSKSPEFQRNLAGLLPFSPLWESTTRLTFGIRLDDRLRVRGVVSCTDRDGAAKFKETLDALVVLGQNAADGSRESLGKANSPDARFWLLMLDTFTQLADGLQVELEDNSVRLAASAPIGAAHAAAVVRATEAARQAAARARTTNNLKQLGQAMHNFHVTYKRFPPASGTKLPNRPREDCPPHSWRVAILPYLSNPEQKDLYKQYRFDLPWDSPENLKVLKKMPAVYRHPNSAAGTTDTSYFALAGAETAFPEGGTRIRDFQDGTSNTLLIVEAKRAVPWTKPEDIPYDPAKPLPKLGGHFEGGFHAASADGAVRFLPDSIDETLLRGLITKADGEVIRWPE